MPYREVIEVDHLSRSAGTFCSSLCHPASCCSSRRPRLPAGSGLQEYGYHRMIRSPALMPGLKFRRMREKFPLPFISFCLHHPRAPIGEEGDTRRCLSEQSITCLQKGCAGVQDHTGILCRRSLFVSSRRNVLSGV